MIAFKNPPLATIYITYEFGFRDYNGMWWHNGIDLRAALGTPVRAVEAGIIQVAKDNTGGYGLYVVVDHGKWGTLYAHLSRYIVAAGQQVKAGQIIGYSGSTGDSTAPHLHFEVRHCAYINFWERSKTDSNVFMRCVDPRDYIEQAVEKQEIDTYPEAINYLVQKNVINTPEFWMKACETTKNLDTLIIKIAKWSI